MLKWLWRSLRSPSALEIALRVLCAVFSKLLVSLERFRIAEVTSKGHWRSSAVTWFWW